MKQQLILGTVCALLTLAPGAVHTQSSEGTEAEPVVFAKVDSYKKFCLGAHEKQYLWSLNSDLELIVEGTLREIARIKLAQPACVSPSIEAKLSDLAIHGMTPGIRYKASLTIMLFRYPGFFTDEADAEFRTSDEMFTAISRKIEKNLLANS